MLPESRIRARRFYELLRRFLPAALAQAVSWDAGAADLIRVSIPSGGVPVGADYFQRLEIASRMDEWSLTTGEVNVLSAAVRELRPDMPGTLERRDPEGGRVPTAIYSLHHETVGITLLSEQQGSQVGRRMGIPGRRGLIVVGNRAARGGGYRGALPRYSDRDVAETLLHETAAHAGQLSAGRPFEHPAGEVERIAEQVRRLFPPGVSAPVNPLRPARPSF